MKVLTFNTPLNSNISYAHTMRQIITPLNGLKNEPIEWFYGQHGTVINTPIKGDICTFVPADVSEPDFYPKNLDLLCQHIQPDILFMHDDPQRCLWFDHCPVPVIYWIPWDNEDWSFQPPYHVLKTADDVVTVAKFPLPILRDMGLEVEQIYNPINTTVFHPDKAAGLEFRKQMDIPEDEIVLTWVGRPGWRKRFSHIIEVARRCMEKNKHITLLLHTDMNDPGNGNNPLELIYGAGIQAKTIFPRDLRFDVGYPEETMNALYNATDIYFAPHGGEGHSLPISEAQACCKPFIATDITTTQEFADYTDRGGEMCGKRGMGAKVGKIFEDRGIKRPYVDIQDMTNKILWLAENEDVRIKMGKEGRKFVTQEVDWMVVAEKWRNVFERYSINGVQL